MSNKDSAPEAVLEIAAKEVENKKALLESRTLYVHRKTAILKGRFLLPLYRGNASSVLGTTTFYVCTKASLFLHGLYMIV